MMTVQKVSQRTGVSIRTLQYYDRIGLLPATAYTPSGYRLYDEAALERLQQILLFRELEFPLREIRRILDSPDFDRDKALQQQIQWLTLKKEHLENLITLARGIREMGGNDMDFSAFDSTRMDEYAQQARDTWGKTDAYQEYEAKSQRRTAESAKALAAGLLGIFAEMGQLRLGAPESEAAQALVEKLQCYITEHYYRCTREIFLGLGQLYAAGGDFTDSIDAVGGDGTADFVNQAIQIFCKG